MVHDFILKPIRKWLWVDPYLGTHFRTYGTSFTKFGTSFIKFGTSDNEAEYEAILTELSLALTLSASKLEICSDFQLFIGQIQGEYEAKDELMARYLSKVQMVVLEALGSDVPNLMKDVPNFVKDLPRVPKCIMR